MAAVIAGRAFEDVVVTLGLSGVDKGFARQLSVGVDHRFYRMLRRNWRRPGARRG
jgi:hypothetical protein